MAFDPKADPEFIRELDAAIQSRLKAAFDAKKIDAVDALYLLIARIPAWSAEIEALPEWGRRKFVVDMVETAFRERGDKDWSERHPLS